MADCLTLIAGLWGTA